MSANDYSRFHWNMLPSYDDYLIEDNYNAKKEVRNGDGSSIRFNDGGDNDDDFFNSGGPCPSCRLAINQETGRLKCCGTGGNETRRFRVKLMLLMIPAVLLPITITLIALSRLQGTSKVSESLRMHDPFSTQWISHNGMHRHQERKMEADISWPTGHNDVPPAAEEAEKHEGRIPLVGMKTSYEPVNAHPSLQRRKRNTDGKSRTRDGSGMSRASHGELDNRTMSLLRAYGHLNNGELTGSVSSREEEGSEGRNDDGAASESVNYLNETKYTQVEQDGDKIESNDTQEDLEETDNFLGDYYPEVEIDDTYYESSGSKDYYSEKRGGEGILSFDSANEKSPGTNQEDNGAFSLSINETTETWSSAADERDKIDDHKSDDAPDLRIFWRDEGNARSIRESRARMMLKYMDKTVDPCQDFYRYACGNWAKRNPIPKDKAGYDTFEMLRESLDSVLRELLEDPIPHDVAQSNADDATIKAKHLFKSCMNYEILEQRMEQPLIQLLDQLGGWPILRPDWNSDKFDWLLLTAQLRLYNNDVLISEWVGPDIKNSDKYVIQFDQTSLGLPTRDYFLQRSNTVYLEAYKEYLIKVATLLGASLDNVTVQAEELIKFETQLATITSSPDERRNFSELYQRMSIGELRTLVPQIDWRRYLSIVLARSVNYSEPVVVFALQYIQDLVVLLSKTRPRTVANYILWRFVRHRVNNLDDRFQEVKQKFYYILFGREQAPSRWKNCVTQVNSNMGMAVGSMFVKKYFDENSKNDTLSMTREIQRSFRELLDKTNWIDDETKSLATEKVNAMSLRIGYPDFILQPYLLNERYKDVIIRPDKYFENTLNILKHLTRLEQDRLGNVVNKTLWNTAPAVVNAYYSRNKNQIMFPAGILQPPFYHRFFPRSLNYGGIGVVIGHEITHGFDDKGRLFDKDGNLHRWWKDEAINGFHRRAQCLIDQYARYTVAEVGMQIDGVNTQGENIADNGGIKQAFRAYERWLRLNQEEDETLPGMSATGKQLFFLNFAQVWCGSMRPEATRNKLKTAVHSPGKFRVIGTLSNSKDFAQVFNCPLGSPMNPVSKCSVW
ncbi:neprilysin-4 isoform X3 [Harpegnathos saltator]|uniref:neprilysin-4 isoform X3 n=1 Tax=Harpegnathos saltator TaxID=610380 RepID=UPI000948B210|nr:neprilysin-4 isoform X3 [Harpegnathos saltator]